MKVNLCLLISASLMMGCSANKATTLKDSKIDIQAGSSHQLVNAKTVDDYLYMAKVYEDKKNHEMAIVAYQKALLIEPNNTKVITGLATGYAAQNLLTVAVPLFEKVVALEANAKHYSNLGYAYYLNQQYEEAKRVLNQAVLMDPDYQQAKHNLALVDVNFSAEKEAQVLAEKNKVVDYVTVNTVETNQPSSIVVLNDDSGYIQQSSSGIYELYFPKHVEVSPIAVKSSVINETNVTSSNNIDNSQQIDAAISGGITFKHVPVVSKLFDLATTGVLSLQLSSNSKYTEVINGNGLKGIAKTVSEKLKERGIENIRVGDAKRFNLAKTHIQYRTGYRDDAVNLNHHLLNRPYLLRNDNLPTDVNIRLVLGRDLIENINQAELKLLEVSDSNS